MEVPISTAPALDPAIIERRRLGCVVLSVNVHESTECSGLTDLLLLLRILSGHVVGSLGRCYIDFNELSHGDLAGWQAMTRFHFTYLKVMSNCHFNLANLLLRLPEANLFITYVYALV